MKNFSLSCALILALVGCADVSTDDDEIGLAVEGLANSETRIPVDFEAAGCDGSLVAVTGFFHTVNQAIANSQGELWVATMNTQGLKGTDDLGRKYVSTNQVIVSYQFNSGASTQSVPFTFKLIGVGSTPDLSVSGHFHQTITPDGTLTAYVEDFRSDCP